ncbi:MAG: hypothetical protein WBG48_02590 [Pricia sp.]
MKKTLLLLLFVAAFGIVSCEDQDDSPYAYYKIATPLTMDLTEFKAQAVGVTEPVPIAKSGKIYAYGNYIFVNDVNRGFHVIDNTDATAPKNIAFMKLEGNYDISIKNNRLFADSYGDLVVFDISDIKDIKLINRLEDAIYDDYGYTYPTYIEWPEADFYEYGAASYDDEAIIGWEVRTERRLRSEFEIALCISCSSFDGNALNSTQSAASSEASAPTTTGQGGSLARFKIVDKYLYTVDYSNINIFDISDLENPKMLEDVQVGWNIETIYNQGDILFIGGMQGMYIYDISAPDKPTFVSEFRHGTACDPVVVDGDYAFVTLRGGNLCGGAESGLYIVDVSDLANPQLKKTYAMQEPYGLGFKDDRLFVCDGSAGLKVYDKTDVDNLKLVNHFKNIVTYDVIPLQNSLLMIGDQVLYQYTYTDNNIRLLSTFNLK